MKALVQDLAFCMYYRMDYPISPDGLNDTVPPEAFCLPFLIYLPASIWKSHVQMEGCGGAETPCSPHVHGFHNILISLHFNYSLKDQDSPPFISKVNLNQNLTLVLI